MNIFAVVKKAINSDLNKPLNITLDEIKNSLASGNDKITRKIVEVIGVPYNSTYASQVLTMDDEPVLSVNGRGRILRIIPVSNKNVTSTVYGTTILTVDDKTLLNNSVEFASTANSYAGKYMVDTVEKRSNTNVSINAFGANKFCQVESPNIRFGEVDSFISNRIGVIEPNGVNFERGFEIRLTQAISNTPNDYGVIVIYELYE